MKNKKIQLGMIIAVSFIVGFGGGILYARGNKNLQQSADQINGGFQRGMGTGNFGQQAGQQRGSQRGGSMIGGEITAKDATSITLKIPNGGSKIVFFSASTTIMKSSAGVSDDIKTGEQVFVTGSQNSDGSVSAQLIQLRSENRIMQPGQ